MEFLNENKKIEFKIFDTLQNQIWSLFPGFCVKPNDLSISFKLIAKTLGELLDKTPDLRGFILNGLRNLINKNKGKKNISQSKTLSKEINFYCCFKDENKLIMTKFAKNYLPILFNIYMMDKRLEKDPQRQLVIDTIKSYLKISDNSLSNEFLMRAYDKYTQLYLVKKPKGEEETSGSGEENDMFMKYSLLDLIGIMVLYANEKNIKIIYELAINGINDTLDKTVQKKSYKILNTILTNGKKDEEIVLKTFVKENLQQMANTFVNTLTKCNSAAKPVSLIFLQLF